MALCVGLSTGSGFTVRINGPEQAVREHSRNQAHCPQLLLRGWDLGKWLQRASFHPFKGEIGFSTLFLSEASERDRMIKQLWDRVIGPLCRYLLGAHQVPSPVLVLVMLRKMKRQMEMNLHPLGRQFSNFLVRGPFIFLKIKDLEELV